MDLGINIFAKQAMGFYIKSYDSSSLEICNANNNWSMIPQIK